jgi:SP family general alpha glucoside:H+ symporter-like MFS transporter
MAVTVYQDPESKIGHAQEVEHQDVFTEKALAADYKADAIEAENAEHNMTVLQAVKQYPMASFWAFVMSCTIVSSLHVSSVLS